MPKAVMLGAGIPLLLLGLLIAAGTGMALSFLGLDGRLSSPPLHASGAGVAIVVRGAETEGIRELQESLAPMYPTVSIDVVGSTAPSFVGVASASSARSYLSGAPVDLVTGLGQNEVQTTPSAGSGRVEPPGTEEIWVASSADGELSWELVPGDWWLVVMNADGSAGTDVIVTASVEVPEAPVFLAVFLVGGIGLLAGGIALIVGATRMHHRVVAGTPPPPMPGMPRDPPPARPDIGGRAI